MRTLRLGRGKEPHRQSDVTQTAKPVRCRHSLSKRAYPAQRGKLIGMTFNVVARAVAWRPEHASTLTTMPIDHRRRWRPGTQRSRSSLARPGGNITGYSIISPELNVKRLALFDASCCQACNASVGWRIRPTRITARRARTSSRGVCRSSASSRSSSSRRGQRVQDAVAEAARQRAQALFVPVDTLFY